MNEEVRKQMIYLASVDVLRRLLRSGKVEPQVIKRLNKKNAETMGCKAVEIS
jgi:hypothetical protein